MLHSQFMSEALILAKKAENHGDVPVGAVIVFDGKIIAKGQNKREKDKNSLLHAEICAIDEACRHLGRKNLAGCTLYVTLEPCPMCAGAIAASRIPRLFYGADNTENGACGSVYNLLYPHTEVFGGIKAEECSSLLKDFFKNLRKKTEQ